MPEALSTMLPFIVMIGIFWVLIIPPQQKEQQAHKDLVLALAKDQKVVLANGIHGRVESVSDSTISLEISSGVRIQVEKEAVARLQG